MRLHRVVPSADTIDLEVPDARERVAEWYASTDPTVRINLVTTISGTAVDASGASDGLTSPTDRLILGVIRSLSDVVVIGAATLRAEGKLMPRSAKLAIVTGSGDLEGHGLDPATVAGRVLVFCPDSSVAKVHETLGGVPAEVTGLGQAPLSPAHILEALTARGLSRVVIEGGPTLATQFLRAELVDELCLTTSPQLGPVTLPVLGGLGQVKPASLSSHAVDDAGFLYSRWSLRDRDPSATA